MRGFARAVCIALLAAACSRGEAAKDPPFDAKAFIATTASLALSDVDVGNLAVRKARLPETKQLAAALGNEQRALLAALALVAQHRGVAMPAVLEDRRAALHQNLSILTGQVFDRAWALAMVQDYDALLRALGDAAHSGDDDLRAFASREQPTIAARRKAAGDLLNRLGGSPFNVAP
jgi:predicted outer membrane protein